MTIFPTSASAGNKVSANVQYQYETLYFQSQMIELTPYYLGNNSKYSAWGMTTKTPSGQVTSGALNFGLLFVSPPLAERFTFQRVSITVYHEEALSGRDDYYLDWKMGAINTDGVEVVYGSDSYSMDWGSKVSTIGAWGFADVTLLKGERVFVRLTLDTARGSYMQMYWGNSSFSSGISYVGTAVYDVPEFPSLLLFPTLMIATLLAVIVFKRRVQNSKFSNSHQDK